jgi:hypothetical protein
MDRKDFINTFINKFNIKTVDKYEYVPNTINETYTNETAKILNIMFNNAEAKDYIQGKSYKWFKGMTAVNKTRFKVDKEVYHVNTRYEIKSVDKKSVMFTDGHSINYDLLELNFIPAHSFTGHSLQGKTIKEKIIVHDVFESYSTARWFWTALSRTTQLKNVRINLMQSQTKLSGYNFERNIESHKEADKQCDRFVDDLVNVEWVQQQYNIQCGVCDICHNKMNSRYEKGDGANISIDRLCNDIGHSKHNCRLTCLRCNVSKK